MPLLMSRQEFHEWAWNKSKGRFERVGGEVIAMAPERFAHAKIKAAIWAALKAAITDAGLPCTALPDGMTVQVDDDTDYEPDASVHCGAPIPPDSIAIPNPVIVVEVISRSSRALDTGLKLGDYFRVASIQHYLVLRADYPEVAHYRRSADGRPELAIITEGEIRLDPPGISISVAEIYAD